MDALQTEALMTIASDPRSAFGASRSWPLTADYGRLEDRSVNTDSDVFFRCDPIAEAENPGTLPTSGFRGVSRNVKRSYPGRKAAKAQLGVTGGVVEFAAGDPGVRYGRIPKRKRTRNNPRAKHVH